jgi:NAD(P)-dependent dehydrogenase (short-subunit alcohol dehydrogenase family)
MARTVFITGTSTGIGRAAVRHFQAEGWNVVATMRAPQDGTELAALPRVLVTRLDVTESASIEAAVNEAVSAFGSIDVLVNNAGFGAYGPLEVTGMDVVRRQFDTNVVGLIEVTKAMLPIMRAQGRGIVINISSVGGRMTFPLGSLYHGSKFAVEGFSEALVFELAPLGIAVKLIEPGLVETDFAGRSFVLTVDPDGGPYQATVQSVLTAFGAVQAQGGGTAGDVAAVIYQAATDDSDRLRYVCGDDAVATLTARRSMEDADFLDMMRGNFGLQGEPV